MNLIKTIFYPSISTRFNFISGFIVVKVAAVKVGKERMSLVSQLQNTIFVYARVFYP